MGQREAGEDQGITLLAGGDMPRSMAPSVPPTPGVDDGQDVTGKAEPAGHLAGGAPEAGIRQATSTGQLQGLVDALLGR